jgi:hypothetical protein
MDGYKIVRLTMDISIEDYGGAQFSAIDAVDVAHACGVTLLGWEEKEMTLVPKPEAEDE